MKALCGLAFWAALILVSCSPGSTALRVALDPHHPPLEFLDEADTLVGFEVDLARVLAQRLQREVVLVPVPTQGLVRDVPWGGILAGLTQGDYDLVLSSVVTTADRKREWGLSTPYLTGGPILVVRQGGPTGPLAAWKSGALGVVIGTQGQAAVARTPAAREWSRVYYDLELALDDLADRRIEGVVADVVDVAALRADNEKLALSLVTQGPPLEGEVSRTDLAPLTYSAAVAPGNQPLLAQVNQALASLEADGTLAQLRGRWFLSW